MTAPDEVPGGLQGAVGDAVDIGREGFGDEDDTHTAVVGAPCVEGAKGIFPVGKLWPTFLADPPWALLAVPLRFASADVCGFPSVAPAAGGVHCAGLWVR
ncbi:hypothetical protein Srufu_067860 [Streptomyces libani subsp. rufus]|nr:hypothetical protein Srufu_067860 [Streptomyces libani subsp. rufus]